MLPVWPCKFTRFYRFYESLPDNLDIEQRHCQNISGKAEKPGVFDCSFVSGTRDTERTGYFSVLFLFPEKMIFESISTNLKRSRVPMMILLLNHLWHEKVEYKS